MSSSTSTLKKSTLDTEQLLHFIHRQLSHFFPDGFNHRPFLQAGFQEALDKIHACVKAATLWPGDTFDPMHTEQYAIFLQYLSHFIWQKTGSEYTPTRLFALNKALNAFNAYFKISLPTNLFIGHSSGIVLVETVYPEYLVLYQHVTVGRIGEHRPTLHSGLVLYPHSAVIGECIIHPNVTLSYGTQLQNTTIGSDTTVYPDKRVKQFLPDRKRFFHA